jgi:AcrR family transcriptional regulator
MSMMAANAERETLRRSQIIEAALREISAKGSYNVTMESIAKAAGLSKGGVTHYFSSKDQIYEAAFKEFFDIIFLHSKKTMDQCSDPLSKILSFDWLYDWNDSTVNIWIFPFA